MFSRLGNRLAATFWAPVETGKQGEGLSTPSRPRGRAPYPRPEGPPRRGGGAESPDTPVSWLTPVEALQHDQRGAVSVGDPLPHVGQAQFLSL